MTSETKTILVNDSNTATLFDCGFMPVGVGKWSGAFSYTQWLTIRSKLQKIAFTETQPIPVIRSIPKDAKLLLTNHLGENVFASSEGRFIVGDGIVLHEKDRIDDGRFMRGTNPLSTRTCCKAYFSTPSLYNLGVKRFASLIFGKYEEELTKEDRDLLMGAMKIEFSMSLPKTDSEVIDGLFPSYQGIKRSLVSRLETIIRDRYDRKGNIWILNADIHAPFSSVSKSMQMGGAKIDESFLFPHERYSPIDEIPGGEADVSINKGKAAVLGLYFNEKAPSFVFPEGGRIAIFHKGDSLLSADIQINENNAEDVLSRLGIPYTVGQQHRYRSASGVTHSAWIPDGLREAQIIASTKWMKKHGSPLNFVAKRLGKKPEEVATILGGEQIDACAFAVSNCDQGKSFLVADQTGLGKGRILASIREAFRKQKKVFFLTEKPNLFSDFLRDSLTVSGEENPFRNAFRINQDATPKMPDGEKCPMPYGGKTGRAIMEGGVLPDEIDLVLGTYSQFSRKDKKQGKGKNDKPNEKKNWFATHIQDNIALLDESHVATGDSALSEFLKETLKTAHAKVYSSATHSKSDAHFSFYHGILKMPRFLPALPKLTGDVGDACRFRIMEDIVRNGNGVRREQDLSGLNFRLVEDDADNSYLGDAFSAFIEGLFRLSRIMNRKLPPHPDIKGDPIVLLGGRLYRLTKQFFLALKADFAVRMAKASIDAGRKPILVTESTLESLLKKLEEENDVWGEEDENETVSKTGMDFPSILAKAVDDTLSGWDLNFDEATRAKAYEKAEFLFALCNRFSCLPASPIDYIRDGIGDCGEISGRTTLWSPNAENKWDKRPRNDPDRDESVRMFNDGRYKALVVTRAGCSGISLHSSPIFLDKRPRDLIEIQIPANVAERLQFFGRVFRKGQVELPSILTLSSGIPAEARMMLMQSKKLPGLTSYSGGKDGHPIAPDHGLPNLYSSRGIRVCTSFLDAYPEIRKALGIPDASQADAETRTDRLLARLVMLPVKMQEDLMDVLGKMISMPIATTSTPHVIRSTLFDGGRKQTGLSSPSYVVELDFPEIEQKSDLFASDTKETIEMFFQTLSGLEYEGNKAIANLRKIISPFLSGSQFQAKGSPFVKITGIKAPSNKRFCAIPEAWLFSFEMEGAAHVMSGGDAMRWIRNGCPHSSAKGRRIAIVGNPFRTLTLKNCGVAGEFINIDSIPDGEGALLLDEGLSFDDAFRLPVPVTHPDEAYSALREFPDIPLRSRDRVGKSLFLEKIKTGTRDRIYRISWEEGWVCDDGDLDSFAFRKMTGAPKIGGDGRYEVYLDGKYLRQFLWHCTNRDISFSLPPNKRKWRNAQEVSI